ncbi:MAG: hypothetical protein MHM6MM_006763 [Cercozoa sp. M6MM]
MPVFAANNNTSPQQVDVAATASTPQNLTQTANMPGVETRDFELRQQAGQDTMAGQMFEISVATEQAALRALFDSLHGSRWRRGWNLQKTMRFQVNLGPAVPQYVIERRTLCGEFGVTCTSNGRVLRLELESNGLFGSAASAFDGLASLGELEVLNLAFNDIEGELPLELLASFVRVIEVNLAGNALRGRLPVGLMSSALGLERLDLSYNMFDDTLRDNFVAPSLRELQLSSNQLRGTVPMSLFERAPRLRLLYLDDNRLSGDLFPNTLTALPQWSQLRHLCLSNNQLGGPLDRMVGGMSVWSNATSLRFVAVDGNEFSGALPTVWFDRDVTPDMRTVLAFENRLSGGSVSGAKLPPAFERLDVAQQRSPGGPIQCPTVTFAPRGQVTKLSHVRCDNTPDGVAEALGA